jgi:hypothetical protein
MTTATTVGLLSVAALFVLFFLARRMLRLAFRLMLAGLLVLILIAGGLFWWSRSGDSPERDANRPAQPARRTTPSR